MEEGGRKEGGSQAPSVTSGRFSGEEGEGGEWRKWASEDRRRFHLCLLFAHFNYSSLSLPPCPTDSVVKSILFLHDNATHYNSDHGLTDK